MAEVTVIAQIKTKEGMEEKVGKELLKLVVPTRSEQGCIVYNLHQSAESKSLFMFYECWKSKKDFDEHLQKPHIKAFVESAGEMLAEPMSVSLWEMLSKR
jgi:quinol monooxygenase YgiN